MEKSKVIIGATIIILLILSIDLFIYVNYVYKPRQENYVWFNDGLYIKCEQTKEQITCILPDNKTIEIKRSYDIELNG